MLVVGAGVAGVALAQLLRRQGLHPVLVERAGREAGSGYMLALMPLVDPVVAALGARDAYLAVSVGLDRYRFRDPAGRQLGQYSLATLFDASATTAASAGASCWACSARPAAPSPIRHRLGGWVAWAEPDRDVDLAEELWGAGVFVGTYPVKGRLGVIVAGHRADTGMGTERFVAAVRRRSGAVGPRIGRALDAVARDPDAYWWLLTDCRADAWSVGRVALLGDAAAGFLPTAGIGAAMANSRQLARLKFTRSRALSGLRNTVARFIPLRSALRPITRLLRSQPGPVPAAARR